MLQPTVCPRELFKNLAAYGASRLMADQRANTHEECPPVATAGVPAPQPEPEFPMSPPDFLSHFLSSDALRILRLVHKKPLSGKEIAAALDMAAEDKSPTPELRFRLKDLKERSLVEYDGREYRLSTYSLALDSRIGFLNDS